MAYQLKSKPLAIDVAFKTSDGTQYPANWLRLSTADEKKAIGITEDAEPTYYDRRFYLAVDKPKDLADSNAKDKDGKLIKDADGNQVVNKGLKTLWVEQQKQQAGSLLAPYDWYVIRKAEASKAIPTAIKTYRTAVRTACATRETEIDNCADTAALVTLYSSKEDGTPNMTQYPDDPNG